MPGRKIMMAGGFLLLLNLAFVLLNNQYEVFTTIIGAFLLFVGFVMRIGWHSKSAKSKALSIEQRLNNIEIYSLCYLLSTEPLLTRSKVQDVLRLMVESTGNQMTLQEFETYITSDQPEEDLLYEIAEIKNALSFNQKKELIISITNRTNALELNTLEIDTIKSKLS